MKIVSMALSLTLVLWAGSTVAHGHSGGSHYSYGGGHYAGGHGSSHRGGHYHRNVYTGNHYRHHR